MIDLSGSASPGRRVLLYSNDTYGSGHLRQSLQIAARLTAVRDVGSVLVVASCPEPVALERAGGVDAIILPAALETGASFRSQTLGVPLDDLVRVRGEVVRSVVDSYRPDLMIVDDLPVGFEAELWPTFRQFIGKRERPRLLLGLRDVVDDADRVADEWSRLDAWSVADRMYDRVLVYGDERLPTTATELRLDGRLGARVRHVGYLGTTQTAPEDADVRHDVVVVVAPDDAASAVVLDVYAALLAALPTTSRLRTAEARAGDRNVGELVGKARAVVAIADYPTVCAVLASGVPALLVPRSAPSQEQALRAARLAGTDHITAVAGHELTVDVLRDFITRSLSETASRRDVAVDGIERIAEEAEALLSQPASFGPAPVIEPPATLRLTESAAAAPTGAQHRVGYVVRQFPQPPETSVLSELLGLEHAGVGVHVLSLGGSSTADTSDTSGDEPVPPARLKRIHAPVSAITATSGASLRALFADLDNQAGPDGARQARALLHRLPGPIGIQVLDHALQVAEHVRAERLDHLHAHYMEEAAYTTFVAHVLTGVPFSVTVHSGDTFRHNIDREAFSQVASAATAVVCASEASRRHIADELLLGRDARVEVIPSGAPVVVDEGEPGAARIGCFVLAVGELHEKKGLHTLVEACAQLLQEGTDIGCAIVGDGPERELLAARIRSHGIGDRVRLAGALPHEQVIELMRKAMVLAAPSTRTADGDRDDLPTAVVEAMACGTPVVSTAVSGIPELVDDGVDGILVPTGDTGALAAALRLLVGEHDTWSRLSEAAVAKVHRQCDSTAAVRQLAAIFGKAPAFTAANLQP